MVFSSVHLVGWGKGDIAPLGGPMCPHLKPFAHGVLKCTSRGVGEGGHCCLLGRGRPGELDLAGLGF